MKPEVENELLLMYREFDDMRKKLDRIMYGGEALPNEDHARIRKIYDAICNVQDLY